MKTSLLFYPRIMTIVLMALVLFSQESNAGQPPRPNIIVILSDDMGFSDIGCYGGEIQTPVLDGLAGGGLRFTQFYNTARCCPTRASLLTGLYPHQAGIGHMMEDNGVDGYRGELNRRCRTLAEVLKPAGYATFAAGKWHVTKHVKPGTDRSNWPLQRGFDRFYGTIHGAGSFYDPNSLTRDNTLISPYNDPEYQPETYYYTDAISDQTSRFIREHHDKAPDQPFFSYVAFTAAHWPMHALPEDIQKYKGKYNDGYGAIRKARLGRMKSMGILTPDTELSPQAESWDNVENREWELRCMEVYAAMIDRMDRGIGRIVETLKQTNRFENTLILFMQDNGGCAETLGRTTKPGLEQRAAAPGPAMTNDQLQPDMIPEKSRAGWPVLQGPGVMPGPADTYIAYGRGWANVSNTPFREYKHWVHEGGISTPLIAHWPAGVNRHGELDHQPGHLIDIMATCVELSGATYPEEVDGSMITPLEGRSLVPAFQGQPIQREAIYWEHEGNRAVRQGDWKLVAKGVNGGWELYDIRNDRIEMHDLAKQHPDRVEAMAKMWQNYAERAMVLPLTPYDRKDAGSAFSSKKRFELKPGQSLTRAESPMIKEQPLSVTIHLRKPGSNGVLVSQGGTAAGISIYLKNEQLHVAARINNQLHTLRGANISSAKSICVQLKADGSVIANSDNSNLLNDKLPSLLNAMPVDGLDVGTDNNGLVGEYPDNFRFDGKIESVIIELDKP